MANLTSGSSNRQGTYAQALLSGQNQNKIQGPVQTPARSTATASSQPLHSNPRPRPRSRSRSRSPSPFQKSNTSRPEETSYILTLLTDKPHHKAMTGLRDRYFPHKLNKLSAHLTLFHALPGSKLDSDILPCLESLTHNTSNDNPTTSPHPDSSSQTPPITYDITATHAFRLSHGIGISVADDRKSQAIHAHLQDAFRAFLSPQDLRPLRLHYTVMNKVDSDAEIDHAMDEIKRDFKECKGEVLGLGLWRYEKGFWRDLKEFRFGKK